MTQPISIKNLKIGEGIPKICVPLIGTDREGLFREAHAAKEAGADMAEWRADFFEELMQTNAVQEVIRELSGILGQIPLLFTIRTKKEGGNLELTTKDYVNLNLAAAGTGKADLVDVEAFGEEQEKKALVASLQELGTVVVASVHNFEKTESRERLLEIFQILDETGADILKMAMMPKNFEDTACLMQTVHEVSTEKTKKPVVGISMGNMGSISRISGENFGSCITFATVGASSAPGQFPIRELRMMMEQLHKKNG